MSARAWVFFASVSVLWGMPYLFIKIAVDEGMSPAFLSWARLVLGFVVVALLAWRAGVLGSLRGRWRVVAMFAIAELAIPFPLIAFGEERVSSSLAAILIAAVPLIIAVLALRFDRSEQATGRRLVGLVVGFSGVVALVGLDVAGTPAELVGALVILVAAVGYSIGPMMLKRGLTGVDPRAIMTGALGIAAIVLTPFAATDLPASTPSTSAIVSIVVLAVFSTALALVFYASLVAEVGPSRASVITYVAPVVAVALGVAVLDERPGAGAIAGLLLILAGSWLSTDGRVPPGLAAVVTRMRRRSGSPRGKRSGTTSADAPPAERAVLRGANAEAAG